MSRVIVWLAFLSLYLLNCRFSPVIWRILRAARAHIVRPASDWHSLDLCAISRMTIKQFFCQRVVFAQTVSQARISAKNRPRAMVFFANGRLTSPILAFPSRFSANTTCVPVTQMDPARKKIGQVFFTGPIFFEATFLIGLVFFMA